MNVTRLQFPPQTGPYAIKVKEGDRWHHRSTVRLEISVGQAYHEGEKLECAIKWAKARFAEIIILCNDTLQRYNLAIQFGGHPNKYLAQTYAAGTEWIAQNKGPLKNTTIIRWEDWRNLPRFANAVSQARDLYRENQRFNSAVNTSISEVFTRRLSKGLIRMEDQEKFRSLSLDYLMEETAGLAIAYETFPGISAYPGTFLEMWRMFIDTQIEGELKGLSNAHCLRIDFDRKKPNPSILSHRLA